MGENQPATRSICWLSESNRGQAGVTVTYHGAATAHGDAYGPSGATEDGKQTWQRCSKGCGQVVPTSYCGMIIVYHCCCC